MLSMTSSFRSETDCPRPDLEKIAQAGFSHVHWCHEWYSGHFYTDQEVEQIGQWLRQYGLRVRDMHCAESEQGNWGSPRQDARRIGMRLVVNRMDMLARLGGQVLIMHVPAEPPETDAAANRAFWEALRRSLDELKPLSKERGIRLAVENGAYATLDKVLSICSRDYVGVCYDSGHGNLEPGGLDWLAAVKDRLISVHLHDNDGKADLHKIPFTGTVDFDRVCRLIAESPYTDGVQTEAGMGNMGIDSEQEFLRRAFGACRKLQDMIDEYRKAIER